MKKTAVILTIVGVLFLVLASPVSASRYAFGEKETFYLYVSAQAVKHSSVFYSPDPTERNSVPTVPFPDDTVPNGGVIYLSGLR